MSELDAYLSKVLDGLGPVEEQAGGSGYFNKPDPTLDPRLFTGTVLRPEVRSWILQTFYGYFGARFHRPEAWSTVWLAGSGISYQWSGDRSNGDLDVLIGVDFPKFFDHNLDYVGMTEHELADMWNSDFKTNLWPKTAQTVIGTEGVPGTNSVGEFSGVFEVTFYINPGSTDIRDIHPYAAYNVSDNSWTVKPPTLPEDPESLYPQGWWDAIGQEKTQADSLINRYNTLSNTLHAVHPTSPGWSNALSGMGLVLDQARTLFDDIHLGRRKAFGQGGQGYGDFFNFRWQAHKRLGTMQALASLANARGEAQDAMETDLYGHPLDNAATALTKAALWNTTHRRV
jgi:hypothetical protein